VQTDQWTAGAGISFSGLALDYALAAQELGFTHRVSLTYRFGNKLSAQRQERERLRQEEIDHQAGIQAEEAVKRTRADMDKLLVQKEKRYRREKQELLANQEKVIAEQLQRQATQHQQAMALEYFKSLHYFNGLRDYLNKVYPQAVAEFQTVAKYDPNFLELKFYLDRAQQLSKGKFKIVEEDNLKLYYHGIDLYVENRFDEAIQTWKEILKTEPTNLMVLRNIEDAESRRDALNKAEGVEAVVPLSTLQGKGESIIGEGAGNTVLPENSGNSASVQSQAEPPQPGKVKPAVIPVGNSGPGNAEAPKEAVPAGVTGPVVPVMEKKP
jgi:tetratricopeptide (TPR) repeat protein